jgi:hypothetical protein
MSKALLLRILFEQRRLLLYSALFLLGLVLIKVVPALFTPSGSGPSPTPTPTFVHY